MEIVNFLVLVWLLKRFFYKPLQAVISRRQKGIESRLAEAGKAQAEARDLKQQYEQRLENWKEEARQARDKLQRDIHAERQKLQKELEDSLQKQREQAEIVQQRQQHELRRQMEQQAMEQGSQFAAKLLQQGAGPELQQRLLDLLLGSLEELTEAQRRPLREQMQETAAVVEIVSAFPLEGPQRQDLEEALRDVLQQDYPYHYIEDPKLLSGLRITVGPWQLGASVRDELHAFVKLAQAAQ
nr:F0F1 ATP synthase subunit delta [Microbulbifer sediminum]